MANTDGLYNGASFYRSETSTGFQLIQGGIEMTQGKTAPPTIADEFNQQAAFNSPGLLAMANTGQPNSGSSEFFITAPNEPLVDEPQSLNYGYTVFGQLLTGQAIYNDILNVPTTDQGGINYDNTPVTITSASVTTTPSASVAASQFGVLQITEPNGYSGSAQITVTAHGSDSTTAQQSFTVVAAPPTPPASAAGGTGGPMVLNPVSNQTTTENSSVSFQVSAAEEQFLTATPTFTVTGTNSFTGARQTSR